MDVSLPRFGEERRQLRRSINNHHPHEPVIRLEQAGVFWMNLEEPGVFWMNLESSRRNLESSRRTLKNQEEPGVFWMNLVSAGRTWMNLESPVSSAFASHPCSPKVSLKFSSSLHLCHPFSFFILPYFLSFWSVPVVFILMMCHDLTVI